MLKEVVQFMEEFNKEVHNSNSYLDDLKDKKFVVIKTKNENNKKVYNGFELLQNLDEIKEWLEEHKYYDKILKRIDFFLLPTTGNKALGSTSGLLTFTPILFKLSEKNLEDFLNKLEKTKFNISKYDEETNIDNIHEILKCFWDKDCENKKTDFKDYHVIVDLGKEKTEKVISSTEEFINRRIAFIDSSDKKGNINNCPICGEEKELKMPNFLSTLDDNKIYLHHKTSDLLKNGAFNCCVKCALKAVDFKNFLKKKKIKIIPIFVDKELRGESIKILSRNNSNSFHFIFEEINKKHKKSKFDFYLLVLGNKDGFIFFDYVQGYKWKLDKYKKILGNEQYDSFSRKDFEKKIFDILKMNTEDYFSLKSKKDNQETQMIYKYRQKLFHFVYRNKKTITKKDIEDMIIFRIEKMIKNNKINKKEIYKKEILDYFDVFLNSDLVGVE